MQTWMRRRGDRVTFTTGKYAGHQGTVESNVYQRMTNEMDAALAQTGYYRKHVAT